MTSINLHGMGSKERLSHDGGEDVDLSEQLEEVRSDKLLPMVFQPVQLVERPRVIRNSREVFFATRSGGSTGR